MIKLLVLNAERALGYEKDRDKFVERTARAKNSMMDYTLFYIFEKYPK